MIIKGHFRLNPHLLEVDLLLIWFSFLQYHTFNSLVSNTDRLADEQIVTDRWTDKHADRPETDRQTNEQSD